MLKRINKGLPPLIMGILVYGLLVQLIGVWFVDRKWQYTIGLWYGLASAIGMSIHMAVVIYDAVTIDGPKAKPRSTAKSMLRYIIVAALFALMGFFQFGNVSMAFIGVMGLKISAYLQPVIMKLNKKGGDVGGSEY